MTWKTSTTHIKLGPCGADSQVGGFVYVLGPCGEFLLPPQSSQVFSVRGFVALFSLTGTLGCMVCLAPQLFLLVYLHANVGPPTLTASAFAGPPAAALP